MSTSPLPLGRLLVGQRLYKYCLSSCHPPLLVEQVIDAIRESGEANFLVTKPLQGSSCGWHGIDSAIMYEHGYRLTKEEAAKVALVDAEAQKRATAASHAIWCIAVGQLTDVIG